MTKTTVNAESFVRGACEDIARQAAGRLVLCAGDGGLNSAVCAALGRRAVGDRLVCVNADADLSPGEFVELFEREARRYGGAGCVLKGSGLPDALRELPGNVFFDTLMEPLRALDEDGVLAVAVALGLGTRGAE